MKKRSIHIKFVFSCIIFIILISINIIASAKYVFEYSFTVANVNIDLTKPIIEVLDIQNTNEGYQEYANKTHVITLKVKVTEKNIDIAKDTLDPREIEVRVDEVKQNPQIWVNEIKRNNDEIYYDILLGNIEENGNLTVIIKDGAIINTKNMESDKKVIDTQITIDNIAPIGLFREEAIKDGKSEAVINTFEQIREIEGWEFLNYNTELRKVFTYNIAFKLKITDYAQNSADVEIVITQARNIENKKEILNSEWMFNSRLVKN